MLQAYDDSVTTILKQNAPSLSYVNNEWDTLRIQALSKNYASFSGVVNSLVIMSERSMLVFGKLRSFCENWITPIDHNYWLQATDPNKIQRATRTFRTNRFAPCSESSDWD